MNNSVYDNWERLVTAVLRREELRELARAPSLSSTEPSSRFSLSFSSSSFTSDITSPPHDHVPEAVNKTDSSSTRRSLFSRIFGKGKVAKQKDKFLPEDAAFLLRQRLSGDYLAHETIKIFRKQDIWRATNKYEHIIGKGGYSTVYKGVLPDFGVVAIKQLVISQQSIEDAINEAIVISKINHRNAVKLLGYCLEKEAPSLVYEFIPNGSLWSHIQDPTLASTFSWEMRIKVAAETAGVLAYLHSAASTPIVHRDVKTANILLDHTYTAKLIDFGSSRFVSIDHPEATTLVRGTLGYLDPEYFLTSKLTEKSDVYSFGVVLAELLTGRKPLSSDRPEEERNLASFFCSAIQEKQLVQFLDSNLAIEDGIEQLTRVAKLTERCLKLSGEARPSMKEVAMELEALLSVQNHQWSHRELSEEETLESVSGTTSPSNSDAGFHSQNIHSCDYLIIEQDFILPNFSAEELRMATNNYDEQNIIGRGGHGTIYKGILPNYGAVAIKKSIIRYQGQMDKCIDEIKIVSRINHQNVVNLLGCCLKAEFPFLVYELIANGTLFSHIHDPNLASSFQWELRIKVAAETAAALAYLHSVPIIHGDVKTANVLLDLNYTAKVSDFGASGFHPLDHSDFNTKLQGTIGYLDPEYLQLGQLTEKSDVYSFGVVLAELLTAEKAISQERSEEDRILPSYFVNALRDDRLLQILDENLVREDRIEQLKRVAKLTEECIKPRRQERPSMKEVAMELEALRLTENHPWTDV